jgi:hypothetical protein
MVMAILPIIGETGWGQKVLDAFQELFGSVSALQTGKADASALTSVTNRVTAVESGKAAATTVTALSDRVTVVEGGKADSGTVTTLAGRVTAVETNKAPLADLTALTGRVSTVEGDRATTAALTAVSDRVAAVETGKASATTVTALDSRVTALEGSTAATEVPSMLNVPLTSGETVLLTMPFTGEVTGWTLIGNASGTASVDIRKGSFGAAIPTAGNSMVGTTAPALSNAQTARALAIPADWDKSFVAGDLLAIVAGAFTGITTLTLALHMTRTGTDTPIIPDVPVVPGTTYQDMILSMSGLVHYYPLNETSGTVVTDIKGGSNGTRNAEYTAINEPAIVDGGGPSTRIGVVVNTVGATLPNTTGFDFSAGNRSVEMWFKNLGGGGIYRTPIGVGSQSTGTTREFRMNVSNSNVLRASWYTTAGAAVHVDTGLPVDDTHIYHVVLTRDGTNLYLDLDGVRYGPTPITTTLNRTGTQVVRLGAWGDGSDYFKGWIGHLAVYNRALTASEAAAHNAAGRP